jgi:hypothetical protein
VDQDGKQSSVRNSNSQHIASRRSSQHKADMDPMSQAQVQRQQQASTYSELNTIDIADDGHGLPQIKDKSIGMPEIPSIPHL